MMQEDPNNSTQPPEKQAAESDGAPKFGRLLIVLAFSILMVVLITFGSQAYYTP